MAHWHRFIRLLACAAFALVLILPDHAEARKRMVVFGIIGMSDALTHIQDVPLQLPDGKSLYLGYYSSTFYLLAGVGTTGQMVLGIRGQNAYIPLPSGDELRQLQQADLLPDPLPIYTRPFADYLIGYLLWIILAAVGLLLLVARWAAGRTTATRTAVYEQAQSTEDVLGLYQRAIRRTMVSIMASDGEVTNDELATIQQIYTQPINVVCLYSCRN